jgi:single-strand DNA-binding protein
MNNVTLMGRICAPPELKTTISGISVTNFTLAIDRYTPKGQEKQTDFINIVAWRGTAEFVCKYFSRGSLIALQGSIQTRSYTDRAGNNRTAFEVVADKVFFTGEKQREPEVSADASAEGDADFEEIVADDELPF